MEKIILASEGLKGKGMEEAFKAFNQRLLNDPDVVVKTIESMSDDPSDDTKSDVTAVTDTVLAVTDQGRRIGLSPPEPGWADVFQDPDHRAALSDYSQAQSIANKVAHALMVTRERLARTIEGSPDHKALASEVDMLSAEYEQHQQNVLARARQRGLCTLQIIARSHIATTL